MAKAQKPEFAAEKWDKKKIFLAVLVISAFVVLGLQLKTYFLDSNYLKSNNSNSPKDTKGTSISPTISIPSAKALGEEVVQNLNNIQQEINSINVQDIATSSPQVKKILEDIKALPNYPANQAKDMCIKFCSGL
ncbi:MAG: hypothetical protein WD992_00120 [Candidatus Levyibacteriota bacterium]